MGAVPIILNMRKAEPIILSDDERLTLGAWANARSLPLRLVKRARIIQMAADGITNQDIALKLEISRPTVQLWRFRFLALRLSGLIESSSHKCLENN